MAGIIRFIWNHPANRGCRMCAVTRAIVFQLRGRILGRPSIARFGKRSRVRAYLHSHGGSRAIYANTPDWLEMMVWQQNLSAGDLFVDVGANIGLYTILAAELGATVIAIEPAREARRQLEENLELNDYKAEVLGCAIGDELRTVGFTTSFGTQNRLSLDTEAGLQTIEVEMRTLDDILGRRTAAGLKIDVEGAEWLVIRGARNLLRERRIKLIQVEWNEASLRNFSEDRVAVLEMLREAGYRPSRPDAAGRLEPVSKPELGPDLFFQPVAS